MVEPANFLRGESRGPITGDSIDPAREGDRALAGDRLRYFPFLKLPLELRRDVYTYVLIQDKQPLRLTKRTKTNGESNDDSLAILTANRQVNLEAFPVFVSVNTFKIYGTNSDFQWLKKLGPDGQKSLRNVTFSTSSLSYFLSNFRTFNILAGCPRISLTINVHLHQLINLHHTGIFGYLHGFSRATCSRAATVIESEDPHPHAAARLPRCPEHRNGCAVLKDCVSRPFNDSYREYGSKRVQLLFEQFLSACPKNCKVHKARSETRSASVVLAVCGCDCPDCYAHLASGAISLSGPA